MKFLISIIFLILASAEANAEWKTDTELGLVSQSGNTVQDNLLFKTNATKTSGKNTYNVFGTYLNSSGQVGGVDVRLGESARAGLKYTRTVSKKMGLYGGLLWEKDRFAGFESRIGYDLGLRYSILESNDGGWNLFNETGYRRRTQYAYVEGPGKGDRVVSDFGRLYFEADKRLSKTSTFRIWTEYLYDFADSDNYEINFEPSVNIALGEFLSKDNPAKVSLALAYKGMFDNVPATVGFNKYDSIFSTSIKVLY